MTDATTTSLQVKDSSARLSTLQTLIEKEFENYPSRTIAFKALSEKMQVSDRTIRRILNGTHTPNYHTIIKVYRYLLGTKNDRDTIAQMPEFIRDAVVEGYDNFSLQKEDINFSPEVDFYIKNDSVFRGIYLETCAGTVHKDKVSYEFGQHGLTTLEKMVKLKIIKEIEPDIFSSGVNRAQLDTESLTDLSKHLVENKFNTNKLELAGENFCQFLVEGIDRETYNEILTLEWETKNKRLEILKNANPGPVKYWSAVFVDTLSKQMIYDDNQYLSSKEVLQ